MMTAKTLLELAGSEVKPTSIDAATLILVDYQNEYLEGPLRLADVDHAVAKARTLLKNARKARARIIHVAHRGAAGGLFDRDQERGTIITGLRPYPGEVVVEKVRPNAFSATDLAVEIGPAGTPIIVAGFMTHNCVSSTVRAAFDLGYAITVAGDACATRDLPSADGMIAADQLQRATLAALADRHAAITTVSDLIPV